VKTITASVAVLLATASAAFADDEIQIYNAQIAAVGQWTFQQHLNYTFNGRKEPDFPGGLVPNHALNGTPEFAYGMTDCRWPPVALLVTSGKTRVTASDLPSGARFLPKPYFPLQIEMTLREMLEKPQHR
jgi:hypothetical protein